MLRHRDFFALRRVARLSEANCGGMMEGNSAFVVIRNDIRFLKILMDLTMRDWYFVYRAVAG